jgi:hypothetical protein
VEMLVSLLVGGLLGLGTSWYFARTSGRELRDEARNLAQLSELILHALENAGLAEIRRDPASGRSIGLTISLGATFHGSGSMTAKPTVARPGIDPEGLTPSLVPLSGSLTVEKIDARPKREVPPEAT